MKRMTAAAATALLGLSANAAQAVDPIFVGSDTLETIIYDLIGVPVVKPYSYSMSTISGYDPQGSTGGENAINADLQEIAPMSRFLTNDPAKTVGCLDPQADPAYAGCWAIAKDSITMVGDNTQACGEFVRSATLPTTGYQITDWRQALRIVYAGASGDPNAGPGTQDCNSAVRQELVGSWSKLFQGGCAAGVCASGLKHAFRRDDNSGTTGVFLELLNLGKISTKPFCNGDETQDSDPIRRACAGDGAVGIPGAQQGDTVCGFGPTPTVRGPKGEIVAAGPAGGSLGLVVPVLIATNPFNQTDAAKNCSSLGAGFNPNSGGGSFGRVAWTLQDGQKYGFGKCPNGASTVAGTCLWPKAAGSANFGCIANKNSRPIDTPAGSTFDARIYNLWPRNDDGSLKTYVRSNAAVTHRVAMYKYRQHDCRPNNETDLVGCFAQSDKCTIGYAGYRATENYAVQGIDLNSADPTAVASYPLARNLYLCQIDNFGSSTGTQSPGFVADQQLIYNDILNNVHTKIDQAVLDAGFFTIPTYNKVCCTGTYSAATGKCQ